MTKRTAREEQGAQTAAARRLWQRLRRGPIFPLLVALVTLMVTATFAIYFLEATGNAEKANIRTLGESLWWFWVTFMTVGYGDHYPVTAPGRVVAVFVMTLGVALTTLITATISSRFVARQIREGQGLETIHEKGHTLLLGWNEHADRILEGLLHDELPGAVVLVNELDPAVVAQIISRNEDEVVRFVRGDISQEVILRRANIEEARAAVIVSDHSHRGQSAKADERTIVAALAVKALAPNLKICAELVDQANESNLRRAGADEIVIEGEYTGFLLSNAVLAPGITRVARELMTFGASQGIVRADIPSQFVNRTFDELSAHFRNSRKAILIGLIAEEQPVKLEDMLSDDTSAIDEFIKRKFAEAGADTGIGVSRMVTRINPGGSYKIQTGEVAVLVSPAASVAGTPRSPRTAA